MQVEVKLAELSTVVASTDGEYAVTGRGFSSDRHRVGHGRLVDTVDDDFVCAVGTFDQL